MNKEVEIKILEIMQKIQEKKEFKPQDVEETDIDDIGPSKYFSPLAGFLKYIDKAGFDVSESLKASQVATGFHIADLGLAFVNFIRIPVNYLIAFQLGKKVSFDFSTVSAWMYAGIILGLGLTALLVPGIREILALVLAVVVAGSAIIALTNFYYERQEIKDELLKINNDISLQEAQLELLRLKAKTLKNNIEEADNKKLSQKSERLYNELRELEKKYDAQCKALQNLHNLKFHYEKKLEKMNKSTVVDKCVGVLLASIGLVGGIVAIFFPPVGLGILGITAFLGIGYTLVRVLSPVVKKFIDKLKGKSSAKTSSQEKAKLEESDIVKPVEQMQIDNQPIAPEIKNEPPVKKDIGIAGIMEDYFTHHPQKETSVEKSDLKSANEDERADPRSQQHH